MGGVEAGGSGADGGGVTGASSACANNCGGGNGASAGATTGTTGVSGADGGVVTAVSTAWVGGTGASAGATADATGASGAEGGGVTGASSACQVIPVSPVVLFTAAAGVTGSKNAPHNNSAVARDTVIFVRFILTSLGIYILNVIFNLPARLIASPSDRTCLPVSLISTSFSFVPLVLLRSSI